MSLEIVVVIMAALGGLAVAGAIILVISNQNPVSSRLRSVAMRREELQRQQKERLQSNKKGARYQTTARVGVMKQILEKLKMFNQEQTKDLRAKMMQAGNRGQSAVITYLFMRLAVPLGIAMFLLIVLQVSFGLKIMFMALGAAVGYYIPALLLSNKIQKRQQVLNRAFPDAVDLLLICVEAGLSVEAAFSRVTEDLVDSSPLLAEEIGLTAAELAFLPQRRTAYENLVMRTGLPVAKSLSTSLVQSEKYGTPVAVALRVVSEESRDDRMAAAEKKAGSLPAKLTVPMIAFFLPVLFVVILGPAIIKVLNQLMN